MILPLAGFAFITSVTPGPNNILLLGSGLRFGLLPTVPHILGIQVGVALQLILCAYGLGVLLMEMPLAQLILKIVGTAYLLYLAWNLRNNSVANEDLKENIKNARPFTFIQAVLFQFINPKAWIMTLTAGGLFLPNLDSKFLSILLLCLVFNSVGTPSSGSWAVIGSLIKRFLQDPFWQKCFSWGMVSITAYTALAIWL